LRKLKLEMQVSLDGFAADADGHTSWMVWNWGADWTWDDKLRRYHTELTTSSDCILLSRKMAEEGFIRHWEEVASNPADPQWAFAKPVAEMRKVVFTRTLDESIWTNTELAKGDLVAEVAQLKSQKGKDMLVYGGPTFVSSLIEAGLIDEFHLLVNPVVLGAGRAMFGDIDNKVNLRGAKATAFDCGVVVLQYALGK
jgi:dihydrofolate reductase